MSDVKLSTLNSTEKSKFFDEVNNDDSGRGVLHSGKYFTLEYRPVRDHTTYKCTGVELFICIKPNMYTHSIPNVNVLFKPGIFSGTEPYKDRLEFAIKSQTQKLVSLERDIDAEIARVAKEKHEREQSILNHTNNIKSCQYKIDATMKSLVPNAKSLTEIKSEHLLAESTTEKPFECCIERDIATDTNKYDFSPKPRYLREDADGISEKERQFEVNEAFFNINTIRKTTISKNDVITEHVPISEQQSRVNNKVIHAELIAPDDPHYFTNLEMKNAKTHRPVTLKNPNVFE